MKKVLVLMSTYNGQRFLQKQLDSIFEQIGVSVDVLVRDDGSSDNTHLILNNNLYHKNFRWYVGKNVGTGYSFYDLLYNANLSNYDYFAFSDQDDIWEKDKLFEAVNKLEKSKNDICRLYFSSQTLIDENDNYIGQHILNIKRNNIARFILNDAAGCTEVFDNKLVKHIIQYKPKYLFMHDAWLVKVCLALGGDIIVDTTSHIKYRQHGKNVLGLKDGLFNKLRMGLFYIFKQNVQKQIIELDYGYSEKIINKYSDIVQYILFYKTRMNYKVRLLNVNYYNFWLNVVYKIKVVLNLL